MRAIQPVQSSHIHRQEIWLLNNQSTNQVKPVEKLLDYNGFDFYFYSQAILTIYDRRTTQQSYSEKRNGSSCDFVESGLRAGNAIMLNVASVKFLSSNSIVCLAWIESLVVLLYECLFFHCQNLQMQESKTCFWFLPGGKFLSILYFVSGTKLSDHVTIICMHSPYIIHCILYSMTQVPPVCYIAYRSTSTMLSFVIVTST